jgi:hypothetical protein
MTKGRGRQLASSRQHLVRLPVEGHPPHTNNYSPLFDHLRRPRRHGKIILGNQKVALVCEQW